MMTEVRKMCEIKQAVVHFLGEDMFEILRNALGRTGILVKACEEAFLSKGTHLENERKADVLRNTLRSFKNTGILEADF